MRTTAALLAGGLAALAGCAAPPAALAPTTRTAKVCQLTGEVDRERGELTVNLTESRAGLRGIDTGAPVVAPQAAAGTARTRDLVLLFGDTVPVRGYDADRPEDGDALAIAPGGQDPEQCLRIAFVAGADGRYLSPRVPGVRLASYEIPMAGVALDDLWVFFVTDRDDNHAHGRTVLTRARRDGDGRPSRDFDVVYELSRDKFINVWPAFAADAGQGADLLLFGSGAYRKSNVYLAATAPDALAERGAWRYFAGTDAAGAPRWSDREADAAPLLDQPDFTPCVGELSVTWVAPLGRWLMLYNCMAPRGINLRLADRPWGPWSPATVLFDARRDGYCRFMHASWDDRRCDTVYDSMFGRARVRDWGGEYGPYVLAPFTTGTPGRATVYWTMSTWNPYQVVLMRSTIAVHPGINSRAGAVAP
jgi:hypothetical protein